MSLQETVTQSSYGTSTVIRLPTSLLKDSQYPFKDGDELLISIEGDKLVITKNINH